MQYKIPIQIENEDTIVLGLSLRQLGIMMESPTRSFNFWKQELVESRSFQQLLWQEWVLESRSFESQK